MLAPVPDRWKSLTAAIGEPLAISLVIGVLVVNGRLAYNNINLLDQSYPQVVAGGQVLLALERFTTNLKDAEAGQRGYLLTGAESFLQVYESATRDIPLNLNHLRQLLPPPWGESRPTRAANRRQQTDGLSSRLELIRHGDWIGLQFKPLTAD